jgi:hypothetical protein
MGKVLGFNILLNLRAGQVAYTDLTDPSAAVQGVTGGDTLIKNYTFKDDDDIVDTAAPTKLVGPENPFQVTGVSSTVSSIQVLARRTTYTQPRPWSHDGGDGYLTDQGAGVWESTVSPSDIETDLWDDPVHGSSPWSDVQIAFKITDPEGVTWTQWYDFTITHGVF